MGYFLNIFTMYDADIKKRKGQNLRRIRLKLGLKQKDIAEIIGAKEGNISDMERGERTISDRVMNILCKKWNIDPVEFYYTPEMPVIINKKEQNVIERMRAHPEIADQCDVISEALLSRTYGEEQFRTDSAVQKKKTRRKPA
ncbi:MAG: helix-turn-helix transcriptional regulator [Pseudomonadota bacterium]